MPEESVERDKPEAGSRGAGRCQSSKNHPMNRYCRVMHSEVASQESTRHPEILPLGYPANRFVAIRLPGP